MTASAWQRHAAAVLDTAQMGILNVLGVLLTVFGIIPALLLTLPAAQPLKLGRYAPAFWLVNLYDEAHYYLEWAETPLSSKIWDLDPIVVLPVRPRPGEERVELDAGWRGIESLYGQAAAVTYHAASAPPAPAPAPIRRGPRLLS